jgi:limonene-1,2-epoxide hydrolase
VLALCACGSHTTATPESVARAWSAALNKDDDKAAARLFAKGAEVVQGGIVDVRGGRLEAWNASLPCGGEIERVVRQSKDEVLVVFRLTERPHHACDGPGQEAAAIFRVKHGKIVLWHQTDVPSGTPAV